MIEWGRDSLPNLSDFDFVHRIVHPLADLAVMAPLLINTALPTTIAPPPSTPVLAPTIPPPYGVSVADRQDRPPPELQIPGYDIYPMKPKGVEVLYANPSANKSDKPLKSIKPSNNEIVVSGTFTVGDYINSAGPIIRDGVLDTKGHEKSESRGAIVIYNDGSIGLGPTSDRTMYSIKGSFEFGERKITDLMGGGALVIKDGIPVTSADLHKNQKFDQGGEGFGATQMRKTSHLVIGIRDGYAFLIIAANKSGLEIQNNLMAEKFESAVIFDGHSGLFVNGGKPHTELQGRNSTGLRIQKWD